MQLDSVFVSIVIITHNQHDLFKRALKSAISQDFYKPYEIIVINDSSIDDTDKYMQKIITLKNNIKYRIVNNHSALLSRKDGLDLAKGKYVAFLDGDDYYDCHFITKMYETAIKHQADVVNCSLNYVRSNNKIQKSLLSIDKTYNSSLKAVKALFMDYYVRGFTPTKLYKTDLIKSIDFNLLKDLTVYEDIVMNYLVLKKANKLVNIKDALYYYDKSITTSITAQCNKRIECNIMSALIIKNDLKQSQDKKMCNAFKHSYFRRKLLLAYDINNTQFANKDEKKQVKKQAMKDLKKIYKGKQ